MEAEAGNDTERSPGVSSEPLVVFLLTCQPRRPQHGRCGAPTRLNSPAVRVMGNAGPRVLQWCFSHGTTLS